MRRPFIGNKLNRSRFFLIVTGLLLMLFVDISGCTAPSLQEPARLKVVGIPYLSYVTFYIPQEEGYFAEQGLEVELVKFSTVTDAMPLLSQGGLDVAAGPTSASLINAISQNVDLRIVAGREYSSPSCDVTALVVRKDLYDSGQLASLTKVKGRKVTLAALASLHHFMLTKILEKAGLTLNDVEVVKMTPQSTVTAFQSRAIDLAVVGNPYLEQIRTLGYGVILESFQNFMPGFQQGFIMFGPNLLDKNPDLGNKFLVAYLKGARQWIQGKTKRNLELAQRYTGLDEKTLMDTCWNAVEPDGKIRAEDILSFQDWAYENKFVDRKITGERLIDTRFIDHAVKVLGASR